MEDNIEKTLIKNEEISKIKNKNRSKIKTSQKARDIIRSIYRFFKTVYIAIDSLLTITVPFILMFVGGYLATRFHTVRFIADHMPDELAIISGLMLVLITALLTLIWIKKNKRWAFWLCGAIIIYSVSSTAAGQFIAFNKKELERESTQIEKIELKVDKEYERLLNDESSLNKEYEDLRETYKADKQQLQKEKGNLEGQLAIKKDRQYEAIQSNNKANENFYKGEVSKLEKQIDTLKKDLSNLEIAFEKAKSEVLQRLSEAKEAVKQFNKDSSFITENTAYEVYQPSVKEHNIYEFYGSIRKWGIKEWSMFFLQTIYSFIIEFTVPFGTYLITGRVGKKRGRKKNNFFGIIGKIVKDNVIRFVRGIFSNKKNTIQPSINKIDKFKKNYNINEDNNLLDQISIDEEDVRIYTFMAFFGIRKNSYAYLTPISEIMEDIKNFRPSFSAEKYNNIIDKAKKENLIYSRSDLKFYPQVGITENIFIDRLTKYCK